MAIALDTLAYARRLREAGFSEEQAQGQAEALAAAMTDTLATKDDLRELDTRIELTENHATFAALGFTKIAERAHDGYERPTFITMRKTLQRTSA